MSTRPNKNWFETEGGARESGKTKTKVTRRIPAGVGGRRQWGWSILDSRTCSSQREGQESATSKNNREILCVVWMGRWRTEAELWERWWSWRGDCITWVTEQEVMRRSRWAGVSVRSKERERLSQGWQTRKELRCRGWKTGFQRQKQEDKTGTISERERESVRVESEYVGETLEKTWHVRMRIQSRRIWRMNMRRHAQSNRLTRSKRHPQGKRLALWRGTPAWSRQKWWWQGHCREVNQRRMQGEPMCEWAVQMRQYRSQCREGLCVRKSEALDGTAQNIFLQRLRVIVSKRRGPIKEISEDECEWVKGNGFTAQHAVDKEDDERTRETRVGSLDSYKEWKWGRRRSGEERKTQSLLKMEKIEDVQPR